jgi:hypothetical protein
MFFLVKPPFLLRVFSKRAPFGGSLGVGQFFFRVARRTAAASADFFMDFIGAFWKNQWEIFRIQQMELR